MLGRMVGLVGPLWTDVIVSAPVAIGTASSQVVAAHLRGTEHALFNSVVPAYPAGNV